MKDEIAAFKEEVKDNIDKIRQDTEFNKMSEQWFCRSMENKYSYNFSWMGRPIIQYPQDIIAMQEIIWNVQPDLIIETGIAHGGSLIFYASMMELLGGGVTGMYLELTLTLGNITEEKSRNIQCTKESLCWKVPVLLMT